MYNYFRSRSVVKVISNLDDGTLRVIWGTYQIIQNISWSVSVVFPSPFNELMGAFSVFSLDIIPFKCFFPTSTHFAYVYVWCVGPIVVSLLICAVYALQQSRTKFRDVKVKLFHRYSYYLILFSFIVVPPVSRVQLQGLDCIKIAHQYYLRVDTSIECDTVTFETFRYVDVMFILMYLSIPVWWVFVLSQHSDYFSSESALYEENDENEALKALKFLYSAYQPRYYYFETVEM
jgi:hypothetical protein